MKRLLNCLLLTPALLAATLWVRQDCGQGISIEFPTTPKAFTAPGPKSIRGYSVQNSKAAFEFSYSSRTGDDQAAIKKMQVDLGHMAGDRHGKVVSSKKVSKGQFAGWEFRVDGTGDTMEGLWLIGKGSAVQVTCGHALGDFPDAQRFFNSLKLPPK